jgi:hypothetical protein
MLCCLLAGKADRVQSEPLSGEFPLTGNKTEKFRAFVSKPPQETLYPAEYARLMAALSDLAASGTGNID